MSKTAFISVQAINDSMAALDIDTLSRAVSLLHKARRIDFYGQGSSFMLVHDCYYRIMRIGYPCFYATDPHIMRTSASSLDKHSVAFVISFTGRSKDPLRALEIAKQRGANTICLTGFQDSPISLAADCSILCISNETKTLGESYSNTIAQKVILDGIYNCLAAKKTSPEKQEELHKMLEETRL
jgi:DNA-binding MurR/RpiR family transcriptional regulator